MLLHIKYKSFKINNVFLSQKSATKGCKYKKCIC